MEHLAIDLDGRESQICIRSSEGEILLEHRLQTASVKRYLKGRPPSRVVLETCTEAFAVADAAVAAGHEVRVVPAVLVRSLGVGARGVKSDRSDARTLSEVSCRIDLPSVHIPSQQRDRKTMCGMRDGLVECRTKLINAIVALARKVAGIMYAIWRVGSTYQPDRGAARIDSVGTLEDPIATAAVLADAARLQQ